MRMRLTLVISALLGSSGAMVSCASEPATVHDLAGEWTWARTRIESAAGSCVVPEHTITFELHSSSTATLRGYGAMLRGTTIQCNLPQFPAYTLTMGGYRGGDLREVWGSIRDNHLEYLSSKTLIPISRILTAPHLRSAK